MIQTSWAVIFSHLSPEEIAGMVGRKAEWDQVIKFSLENKEYLKNKTTTSFVIKPFHTFFMARHFQEYQYLQNNHYLKIPFCALGEVIALYKNIGCLRLESMLPPGKQCFIQIECWIGENSHQKVLWWFLWGKKLVGYC